MSSDSSSNDAWAGFKLWYYTPSPAAAGIYAAVFALLTGYHAFRLIQRRTWFCIPFVVGGLFELIGYIARGLAHNNKDSVPIYTIQSLLLLLAPILFAASVYMILGRLVRVLHGEAYTLIRVNWLTKIFVGGDIFCFMIQGAGGGLLASADTKAEVDRDNNIILGGLVLQIIIFCIFVAVAVVFQMRMNKRPTEAAISGPLGGAKWKRLMLGLYATSVLITTRNLFRVIEYGLGNGNYLLSHEVFLVVFDGLLMIFVLAICVMWYDREISKGKPSKKQNAAYRLESPEAMLEDGRQQNGMKKTMRHGESEPARPWS
ncbi:hypothetical protein H2198_010235 [Neophaeococcomyces mojaviensis]|uniref:Uncharacterized protein n=1 Tax=Neophaeococcomyces mojaviensis TaxID=3383035 RepID=A0ACC2ZS68_9EURO|nr:hypothetical protein H2198_010235 [Knufia sp. JES_112]